MKLYKCKKSTYTWKIEECEVWTQDDWDAFYEKATKRAESSDVKLTYEDYAEGDWSCEEQTGEQHGLLAAIQANIDKFQLSDFNSINGHEALCCCDECIALIRAAINPEDEQTGEQQ